MPTDAAVKLPEIEHIKARKDGLDVLADIYRYAELGFDAIEPDDLALFRWYGVYTQRAAESAQSGDPGPSEETDGLFMLRVKFPNGIVSSEQLRTIGTLSERYGRSMGDITTRKFKVSVSACVHRCAQHEVNDIGLVAVEKDGTVGYDVWVGGGLGASARMGRRLDVFARPEDAVEVCRAITEIFRDKGKRTKR